MGERVTIVDYRAGNLTSVRYAFEALGVEARVTRDAEEIRSAERVVFPGVGAAGSAMANLRSMGLAEAVREAADGMRPFLGICLGMQILFERSEEDGGTDTLGVLRGQVRRFPDVPGYKVPQIGWNQVNGGREYYFVHSYYAELGEDTAGTTEYAGVTFTSFVRRGRLWACQFHPEKSGKAGMALLKEFLSC
jgi:glutamine amidotransferase